VARHGAGFTLVELVLVLVLASVLVAVAVPRVLDVGALRVRAHADTLQAELRDLHRQALLQRRPLTLTITASGITATDGTGAVVRALPCPAAATPCIAEAGLRSATFNAGHAARTSTSTGSALDITVRHGSTTRVLRLHPETGAISTVP
jgi:prepilin-type N-terminal cleavage/methylation domain-containing protein